MSLAVFLTALAGVLSAVVVHAVMRRANQLGLVQHADQRSSHIRPTPTGGGLGIVVGAVFGGLFLAGKDIFLIPVLILASAIAIVGLIDDRWPLPAVLRLSIHFTAVGALVLSGGASGLDGGNAGGMWMIVASCGLILAGVWWVNLYNFMDGIDGLAASQTLCMLAGALGLFVLQGESHPASPLLALMLIVGAATLGFLAFNWPPAKIFMGDVGSTFLGYLLFALAVLSAQEGWISLLQWAILGSVFAVDATVTLLVRLYRGEHVLQAHKNHTYQRLARRWRGHRPATMFITSINIVLVLPAAWAAGYWPSLAWSIASGVYVLLAGGMFLSGAGKED